VNETGTSLPPDAVGALERGRVIEAIKIVRVATGLGLKESKDAVDAYLAANPALKERNAATASEFNRAGLMLFVFLALAGVVLYLVLRQRG
jgi:hypothetical protein